MAAISCIWLDDDFLRDALELLVLAVAQFEHGHVDRALMVRRPSWRRNRGRRRRSALTSMSLIILVIAASFSARKALSSDVAACCAGGWASCANTAYASGSAAKATRRRTPKTAAPRPGLRNRSIVAVPSGFEFECLANSVHGVVTRGGAFYSVAGDDFCAPFGTRKREPLAQPVSALSQDSRDKASVCGRKFSGYKGLPRHPWKSRMYPDPNSSIAKNV